MCEGWRVSAFSNENGNTLQHTAAHCNTLQDTARHFRRPIRTAHIDYDLALPLACLYHRYFFNTESAHTISYLCRTRIASIIQHQMLSGSWHALHTVPLWIGAHSGTAQHTKNITHKRSIYRQTNSRSPQLATKSTRHTPNAPNTSLTSNTFPACTSPPNNKAWLPNIME